MSNEKSCAILLNSPEEFPPIPEDFVIAADGGAHSGVKIDLWVGDGDSGKAPQGIEKILVAPEKDETDGELALSEAMRLGFRTVRFYGVTGGRIDQQLGNLSLIAKAAKSGLTAEGVSKEVKIRYCENRVSFHAKIGTVFSILSFFGDVLIKDAKGVKYPMNFLKLSPYAMGRGMSNEATEEKVSFVVEKGGVLLFIYDK